MSIFGAIQKWWDNSQGGKVVRNFGVIDDTHINNIHYKTSAVLRRIGDINCLQLKLTRTAQPRNIKVRFLYFYFRESRHFLNIIDDVEGRIASRQEPREAAVGQFLEQFLKMIGKVAVYNYGRIDNNPHHSVVQTTEMALIKGQDRYWLLFTVAQREHFDWPVSILQPIKKALR
jgi:hypothetical protein